MVLNRVVVMDIIDARYADCVRPPSQRRGPFQASITTSSISTLRHCRARIAVISKSENSYNFLDRVSTSRLGILFRV